MSKQTNFYLRKLALDSPERKPSVFERLGSKFRVVSGKNVCRSWAQNGTCPLNKSCKFAHTHVLTSPSKRSKTETMKKSVIAHKKIKDDHKKTLRSHQSSEREWEGWELGDLEDADEKVLEKRKQELQRELQLQLKKEKELTRKKEKRTDKKRAASTSSSSSTTTESSSSSTSSSTSSSEPRKHHPSRKRKHASSTSDSEASPRRRKKSPKSPLKGKVTAVKKNTERKDRDRVASEGKNKSVVVAKKSVVQKKSYSPGWEKSRGRSPAKTQTSKKSSPHHSPETKKNSSSGFAKNKSRGFSPKPKPKPKENSPKKTMRKIKESTAKDKPRQSPCKTSRTSSPSRSGHKVSSPGRSRRHDEPPFDKRRGHYDERKHSPRPDRSREKDRKRDVRGGRSNNNNNHDDDDDDHNNGGLKKGGKILPLKPSSYNKDNGAKKDAHKSSEKSSDSKSKEEENDKERNPPRPDRDRDRNEKDKSKCDRDRSKHKKGNEEHDRARTARERESERSSARGRDDRCRDREADRLRYAKEREAERQKERDEALERCRERQRERERLEKERKEKEERKHRDASDNNNKAKDFDRELPSLLDLKADNPSRTHADSAATSKSSGDKHLSRDLGRRNSDKGTDKTATQDRDGRDRGTPDKDHDRRDSRRSDDNERRLGDKDYDERRNRDDVRSSSEIRRSAADGRRAPDDGTESRRPWDDTRRVIDPVRRSLLDPGGTINDRRPHSTMGRRPATAAAAAAADDHHRRNREGDLDVRDYPMDERRGRKLMHHPDWDPKDQNHLDYGDSDVRDDWNHPDRLHEWNARYDHKWRDREESRDSGWNHYSRRPPHDEWNAANDWPQEKPRPLYPAEDRLVDIMNEEFSDHNNGKRHESAEPVRPSGETTRKEGGKEAALAEESSSDQREENVQKEGDALSDISDDPDDILNRDDEPTEEDPQANNNNNNNNNTTQQNSSRQIYVRSNEFLFDQRRSLLECLGERSLDFEEISDEELEEEARVSKGIIDVLGADWAGLVQETRPRPKRFEGPGSAHRRWTVDRIISRLGISSKYAGQKFADKLIEKYGDSHAKQEEVGKPTPMEICQEQKEREGVKEDKKVKEEEAAGEGVVYNVSVAVEPVDGLSDLKPDKVGITTIFHSAVPALHTAMKEAHGMKSSLFQSHNRFKRALSARTDLHLRRELCNLPSREPLHFTPQLDGKLFEASVHLFLGDASTAPV